MKSLEQLTKDYFPLMECLYGDSIDHCEKRLKALKQENKTCTNLYDQVHRTAKIQALKNVIYSIQQKEKS